MQNIVCKLDNKLIICSLPGPRTNVQIRDNYPVVNRNDPSDHQTLPLVKVKCVLKTTERAPPLPVNNFTAQNITVLFSACYLAKIY